MIIHVEGDILTSHAQALVNPVNCRGVAGAGLARQFKVAFPKNHRDYAQTCKQGLLMSGVIHTSPNQTNPIIFNFPTKRHWLDHSRLKDIEKGLDSLATILRSELPVSSIAIPRLGCGLGGLDWTTVLPLIAALAAKVPDVEVQIYSPC